MKAVNVQQTLFGARKLTNQLRRIVGVVALCALSAALFAPATAQSEAKPFVTQGVTAQTTKSLVIKVKKPKLAKRFVLKAFQIRGCWIGEGVKSVKVTPAKGKAMKFKLSPALKALQLGKLSSVQFPLKVVATFNEERAVVPGGSKFVAISANTCPAPKKGAKKTSCVKTETETSNSFAGVECVAAADFEENISPAQIVLADGDALELHDLNASLRFSVQGDSFSSDLTDATVVVNDTAFFGPELTLNGNILSVTAPLRDGPNEVSVNAFDTQGRELHSVFKIWAGANTLHVKLVDESNQPLSEGLVTLTLADDKNVTKSLPVQNGEAIFSLVPGTTVALSAVTKDNRTGFLATNGNAGVATITVIGFHASSAVVNNDLSKGIDGWDTGSAPVSIVPHVEAAAATLLARQALPAEVPDQDLVLSTLGQGLQFISRTFKLSPGTRSIEVRYRFQTSEFPGGYFGSKFNDFFNVSIRTLKGGGSVSDGNSMNALGQGAFSASGLTAWRTAKLPVNSKGDDVQIQLGVANVADGAYNSSIAVDYIKESSFAITKAEILDIDNSPLRFISGDDHPYFEKFTHFNGTIRIEGDANDSLSDLELQILEGSNVFKTAKLSTVAGKKLIKKFGKAGVVEIKDPILLFKLFPKDAAAMDSETNKSYSLRIHATSKNGEVSDFDGPPVELLVRYKGTARYDGRDEKVGGDDWTKPSVRTYANNHSLTYGDFSNMNGGDFPPHDEHDRGESIDAWFPGYNSRNASVAQQLMDLLGGTQANPSSVLGGSRIRSILVAYSRSDTNSFYNTIRNVTLRDGRKADRVILPHSDHRTHFHLRVSP